MDVDETAMVVRKRGTEDNQDERKSPRRGQQVRRFQDKRP